MFWGLVLKTNKRYSQILEKSFHLAQAALDTTTCQDEDVQVFLNVENIKYLLCTLNKRNNVQCPLNIELTAGEKIEFSSKGSGIVHLSGSFSPEGYDLDPDESDDDEEEESTHSKVENNLKKLKEKPVKDSQISLQKAAESDNIESSEDDDDDDDESEDPSDDDDDDEDESEEDDSEDEVEEPKSKKSKPDISKQQTPISLVNGQKDKKENSQDKKQKNKDHSNLQKQQQGNKKNVQGVDIVDNFVGNGKEANKGKKVQVYYEGRIKATNKVFDSTKQGAGFKFALGNGEVIKGWDIGVVGMKVGGKRRLTIPANLAYGAKGYPPTIPPNSTLVFDIELKNVL